MFEAYLKWNFCILQHTTFVALIQNWKQGQDKPLHISNLVISLVPYFCSSIFLTRSSVKRKQRKKGQEKYRAKQKQSIVFQRGLCSAVLSHYSSSELGIYKCKLVFSDYPWARKRAYTTPFFILPETARYNVRGYYYTILAQLRQFCCKNKLLCVVLGYSVWNPGDYCYYDTSDHYFFAKVISYIFLVHL